MSRQRNRSDHRRTKSHKQKNHQYKFMGSTMAFTVALATSSGLSQEADRKESFMLPALDVQEQRSRYVPSHLGLSRVPQALQDIPQSITVIPQELLQEQAATSFRDALRNVTGISLAAGEGGGAQGDNLTLRGFTARNDFFLDGIRDQGSYTRDLFHLESLEVLKGPSAVLFGRGSTGGAVNQVSKSPLREPLYSGSFSIGEGLFVRGTADVNQPLSPTAALRVNLMAHQQKVLNRDEIELQRFGLAPSLTFGLGTATQWTLSYLVQSEDNVPDYGLPFLFGKPAPVERANFYGLVNEDYERTLFHVLTARVEHRFSEQLTLRNTLRYSHTTRDAVVTTGLGINGTPTPSTPLADISVIRARPGRNTEEAILVNQTELTWKFDTGKMQHTLSAGMELARETFAALRFTYNNVPVANLLHPETRPDTSLVTRTVTADTDTTSTSFGLYIVDHIRLLPQLDLIGGLRWDHFSAEFDQHTLVQHFDRTDQEVSYRAGLVFRPTAAQSYYFSFGTSFNPAAEALALAANTAETAPEESRNFEIGGKISLLQEALSLQAAVFRLEKTNARTLDPVTQRQVLEGEQRVQGFEIGITGTPLPRWHLSAGYTYLDATILKSKDLQNNISIEGKTIQNTPEHSATLWTAYDLSEKWQIGTGLFYVGERFANSSNTNRVPRTLHWDATVAYQLNKNVQFRLNAVNLTDELYYDSVHPGHVVPASGRTILFTGNFRY